MGSILGPLLFLIYINDIASASSVLHKLLYADDINIFCADRLTQIVTNELCIINDWFLANKLSINVNKTNFIRPIFCPRQNIIT